jgi:hypothetical protein
MSSKNNNEHFFNQDFEVTYEDDPIFHYEEEPLTKREFQTVDLKSQPKPRASGKKKKNIQMPLQGDETILMDPFLHSPAEKTINGKKNLTEEKIHHVQNARPLILMITRMNAPAEKSLLPKGKVTCFLL